MVMLLNILNVDIVMLLNVFNLYVFGITIQLGRLCR
jgi:hypothetical protein